MASPLFSIIIPVYNVELYIHECLHSILSQSLSDYEVILVDDGSIDKSGLICDSYASRYESFHVIHKVNGGLSSARNAGLKRSIGEYVLFLDSDDYWLSSSMLSTLSAIMFEYELDVLEFGAKKVHSDKNTDSIKLKEVSQPIVNVSIDDSMRANYFVSSACNKVYKRVFLQLNNMWFVEGQLSEDIEWTCKTLLSEPSYAYISIDYYGYRQTNTMSISHNIGAKNLKDISDTICKYYLVAIDEKQNVNLLNYLANQYVLWMTISNTVNTNDISAEIQRMEELWSLISFHKYPYVRYVYNVRFLGFSCIRKLLGVYKSLKSSLLGFRNILDVKQEN